MRKYMVAIILTAGVIAAAFSQLNMRAVAAQNQKSTAVFDSEGKLKLPTPMDGAFSPSGIIRCHTMGGLRNLL